MSETLTSRVGRLIAGGFHSIIDAVENAGPESVIEQAIREIDISGRSRRSVTSPPNAWRKIAAVTICCPIRRAKRSGSSVMIWRRQPSSVRSISRRRCRSSKPA
jgi:hypothetical protein